MQILFLPLVFINKHQLPPESIVFPHRPFLAFHWETLAHWLSTMFDFVVNPDLDGGSVKNEHDSYWFIGEKPPLATPTHSHLRATYCSQLGPVLHLNLWRRRQASDATSYLEICDHKVWNSPWQPIDVPHFQLKPCGYDVGKKGWRCEGQSQCSTYQVGTNQAIH